MKFRISLGKKKRPEGGEDAGNGDIRGTNGSDPELGEAGVDDTGGNIRRPGGEANRRDDGANSTVSPKNSKKAQPEKPKAKKQTKKTVPHSTRVENERDDSAYDDSGGSTTDENPPEPKDGETNGHGEGEAQGIVTKKVAQIPEGKKKKKEAKKEGKIEKREEKEKEGEGETEEERGRDNPQDNDQNTTPFPPASGASISPSNKARMTVERSEPMSVFKPGSVDIERERKKLKVIPSYACSTCALSSECPEFKEGYVCAYQESFRAFPSRDIDAVLESMLEIVDANKERLRMGLLAEKLAGGGQADPNITRLSQVVMEQSHQVLNLARETQKVTLEIEGPERGGGGILSKLFSAASLPPSLSSPSPGPTVYHSEVAQNNSFAEKTRVKVSGPDVELHPSVGDDVPDRVRHFVEMERKAEMSDSGG